MGVKKKLVLQTAGISTLRPHRQHALKSLEDQLKEDTHKLTLNTYKLSANFYLLITFNKGYI